LPPQKLIIGLGNPGAKYQGTRHNVGFELVDRLAAGPRPVRFAEKFEGLAAEIEIDFHRVLLLKPQTFMNLSGRSAVQAIRFHKFDLADVLVVCDDLNLPVGKLRLRRGGGDGGQKGLRDLVQQLGGDQFCRLRIGIGDPGEQDAADYVLSRFRPAEKALMEDALVLAAQAAAVWVVRGIEAAMNQFNGPAAAKSS